MTGLGWQMATAGVRGACVGVLVLFVVIVALTVKDQVKEWRRR